MQQQEFTRPEREAEYTRNVNTDPREQGPQASYSDVDMYQGGQKIYPQQPQKKQRRGWLFLPIFILVVLMAMGGLNTASHRVPAFEQVPIRSAVSGVQSISVSGLPTLVMNLGDTRVHIHTGGDANKVLIQTTIEGDNTDVGVVGSPINAIPEAGDSGTTVHITPNGDFAGGDSHITDLDITVADKADIDLHTADGSVDINGVSGHINVASNEGQVNIDNAQGQLNIQNQDGKVAINHFDGQVQLVTGDASIDMNNVNLNGSSSIRTVDGSFSFDGSLAANGTYSIESHDGSVNVTLPADSSFQLVPNTSGGSVQNDFGSTTVGNGPYSTLSIKTADGSIVLHKK